MAEENELDKLTGSIAHATSVLVCIGNDVHALTDIARECKLGKSTVHRVLKLLEQSRFVVQDTINRRYYLGPLLTRLTSNPVTTHEYLIMYADSEMRRLARFSEETVNLDIMIGIQAFSLHEIPSIHDLKVSIQEKVPGPLLAGASLKALLSMLNDKQLNAALDSMNIKPATKRTVTDKKVLRQQILEIRERGYTVSQGEWLEGVVCISAPVRGYNMPLSLDVVGPENRLLPREKEVVKEILTTSARISEKITRVFQMTADRNTPAA